jgi:xanthosine utilization system XapX-like protein
MKSVFKIVSGLAVGFVALSQSAMAAPQLNVPEPGSIALVGLAVGALVVASRSRKK